MKTLLVLAIIILLALWTIHIEQNGVYAQAGTEINFTTDTVAWGTGSVAEGAVNCTLDTEGATTNCVEFISVTIPLLLENIGDTNVTLDLASDVDADGFMDGTNPVFQWKLSENETDSCLNSTGGTSGTRLIDTTYTNVNSTSPGTRICPWFVFDNATDSLNIDLKIVIPSDASAGVKSATITATAIAI